MRSGHMSARDAAIISVVSFKFVMECSKMTDYVLIHGAWRGSWCWKRVRHLMTAGGHRIFTPTLTGLGERVHLLSRDVGLDTHIADVANLLLWEDLRDMRQWLEGSAAPGVGLRGQCGGCCLGGPPVHDAPAVQS